MRERPTAAGCAACWAVSLALAAALPAAAGQAGRSREPGKRFRFNVTAGRVDPIEGTVVETDRPFNETRPPERRDNAESYTFADFGLERSDRAYGLSLEYPGKWVTFAADLTQMRAEVVGAAPRDLFLGVDEVRFGGVEYGYQQIPAGAAYAADLDLWVSNLRFNVTPWTFNPDGRAQFVPWLSVGLFGLGAALDVAAGPATGVIEYESPPRLYVVGGKSSGDGAAFGPEWGVGGELKLHLFGSPERRGNLLLSGNVLFFDLSTTTGDLGIGSRKQKALDYDYQARDARALFEIPLGTGAAFLIGAEVKRIEVQALVEALERPDEEVVALREKFNKAIDFELTSANLTVGFRW